MNDGACVLGHVCWDMVHRSWGLSGWVGEGARETECAFLCEGVCVCVCAASLCAVGVGVCLPVSAFSLLLDF